VGVSRVTSAIVVIVLILAGATGVAAYYSSNPANGSTILGALQSDADFSTLVNALSVAGLSSTLSGSTQYTVFAPTNEAFSSLPSGILTSLLGNPTKLASVLEYQIVVGSFNETEMFPMTSLVTLQGASLPLGVSATGLRVGDNASLTQPEIPCANGAIYPIDTVLIPPMPANTSLGEMTILATAESLGLNYLVEGLQTASLDLMLNSPGQYTLFAPTNAAMTVFGCGSPYDNCLLDLQNLFSNQSAIVLVMQDNIASGNFTSAQLLKAGFVTTLAGQILPVTSTSGAVSVGGAIITQEDIRCSNGYLDVTNLILVPPGVAHGG